MPETRRLCRKCYKRRKLDVTGRCRHCNSSGAIVGHGVDSVTSAIVLPSGGGGNGVGIGVTTSAPVPAVAATSIELHSRTPPSNLVRRPRVFVRSRSDSGSDNELPEPGMFRAGDLASFSAQLDNRAVQQMQMFADFFQSHLPAASAAEVGRARSISYLANIPFINITSPLLSTAINALCLAHIGNTRQDPRLLHASQNSYGNVLTSIRRILSSSHAQTLSSREIVMAIMIISLFDECMPVEHRASNSSMTHLWGAQQYLTATAPSQFDLDHPLDRTLILNVFQNGFWLGMAKRQGVSKDRSDWPAAQDKLFPSRTPYTVLARIPSLLERTDLLLSAGEGDLTELNQLCNELDDIRHDIYTRMQNDHTAIPPEHVHITDTSAFDVDIEEHAFLTSAPLFPSHYRFANPESAVNWACRAVVFLVIDCTLLRIFHFRPLARDLPSRRTPIEVERDATLWATHLCRSVYHFAQLRSLAYIDFLLMFMELAHNFYVEQGALKEAGWCQCCLIAAQTRLDRLRLHRPPTLCRLGDLPAGIKTAGRYRAPQLSVSEVKTRGRWGEACPRARRQDNGACPVGMGVQHESYVDFSTAPSMSSSSTTASSVSPALSMVVPKFEELDTDLKQELG